MKDNMNNSSSEKILYILKTKGPETASALAKTLNMTSMGARQHLQNMTEEGLIEFEDIKQGRGRPARYWKLTEAADSRFPNMHSELAVQLINAAEEVFGEDGISKLLDARQRNALRRYQVLLKDCNSLEGRVNSIAEIRNNDGYMANVEKVDGGFLLHENHCPISTAANRCKDFCDSELLLFKQVLGEKYNVERAEHIQSKARRCSYHISEK